jgi:hypothetical protein
VQPSNSMLQVLLYAMTAVLGGFVWGLQRRLLLWRRRGWEIVGDRTWKNMGQFSGWMCAGCIAGAIAFVIRLHGYTLIYDSRITGIPKRQFYEPLASKERHFIAFDLFYPASITCITFAMNMLLRRVSDHASHRYPSQPHLYNREPLTLSQLLQRRPRS